MCWVGLGRRREGLVRVLIGKWWVVGVVMHASGDLPKVFPGDRDSLGLVDESEATVLGAFLISWSELGRNCGKVGSRPLAGSRSLSSAVWSEGAFAEDRDGR